MKLKNKLQHLVSDSGKSANKISKEVGVSHTTINRLLDGTNKDMKLSTAFKLADALEIDVNEFREEGECK